MELQVDYLIQDQMELEDHLLYFQLLLQQVVVWVNQALLQDQLLVQEVQEVAEQELLVLHFQEDLHKVEQEIAHPLVLHKVIQVAMVIQHLHMQEQAEVELVLQVQMQEAEVQEQVEQVNLIQ